MDTSIIIGRILGPYLLVCGLGFLVSRNFYFNLLSHSDKADPMVVNVSGMLHFFLGMTILTLHFEWRSLYQIIITILGFSLVGKGITYIVIPRLILKTGNSTKSSLLFSGVGFMVVGLYLVYQSYFNLVN
ncbi:MAG: hypothetical protein HWE21_04250 [Cytophagia bacterium]|nr:hypothetical protein [Cytophagia bacterium]